MIRRVAIERYTSGSLIVCEDDLAVEEPLLVVLDAKPFATLMRTPGEDVPLVMGFLFSEGIIGKPEHVDSVRENVVNGSQEIHVKLAACCPPTQTAARSIYLSSSCGVCGRASINELMERVEPIRPFSVSAEFLISLLDRFALEQRQFVRTGGVHAAALFDADGQLLGMEEDVGRHNALDKLLGKAFLDDQLPLDEKILLMSSRASFDIVQKAAMAGIPIVATMGAASSLAADLAQAAGIYLHCFLRSSSVVGFPLLPPSI